MQNRLEQSQKQILSQNMIQSVEILQMSSQDLSDYLKDLSMENPVVEVEDSVPENKREEQIKKLEWLASLDEQNRTYYRYDKEDTKENLINNVSTRKLETLADALHFQLIGGSYSEEDMEVFDYIAQCLDSRGYYTAPVSEICVTFGISENKAREYLEIMKGLEPAGVCASSLQECLLKQLEKSKIPYEVEKKIVEEYLDILGKNQLHIIAKNLKVSTERIKEAQERIQSLNPKPAQGFDNGELFRYIEPDITIVKFQDYFEILLNNYSYPTLHVNKDYLNMMKSDCEKEVKDYLFDKVKQAEQVQDCIARRNSTLLELAKCILDAQKEFFLYGENSIRPFKLREAAQRMGLHESTVSRAVKDKYLQCCWGVYPLSYFFSRGISQNEEEVSVATIRVKQELQKLIEQEDKKHPRSDQKLADLLREQGIDISRRTVTKYREAMKIPNGRIRKTY